MDIDDAPDDAVVHAGIAVGQNVAKADDGAQLRNGSGGFGIQATEPAERLADDLKLSFYRRAQQLTVW